MRPRVKARQTMDAIHLLYFSMRTSLYKAKVSFTDVVYTMDMFIFSSNAVKQLVITYEFDLYEMVNQRHHQSGMNL